MKPSASHDSLSQSQSQCQIVEKWGIDSIKAILRSMVECVGMSISGRILGE